MKLTIGMAHANDYDGVYFSIQSLRLNHDCRDVEFIVVDNTPTSPHGKEVKDFVEGAVPNGRYIALPERNGTAAPRDRIFREAKGEAVLCMDCHVLLLPDAVRRLINWYDSNPDNNDLLTGPLLYDPLNYGSTHFDLRWAAEMWGVWGNAWSCRCGYHFTIQASAEQQIEVHDLMDLAGPTRDACPKCGLKFPAGPRDGCELKFAATACYNLGGDSNAPPFEIPAQGLGLFTCRKDAWLGFNPHFKGFGGEEGYIHEKYRQAGRRCLSLPFLKWVHRFRRPAGIPYSLQTYDKARNYVLGHNELGLSLDPVYAHFVTGEKPPLSQQQWDHLVADPITNDSPPALGCSTCGGNNIPMTVSLDDLYEKAAKTPSTFNEHVPKLRELAAQCDIVVEFAHQRSVSAVAIMAAKPKKYWTIDPSNESVFSALDARKGDTEFHVIQNTGEYVDIPECDMLFEDSSQHTESHILAILERHAPKVRRWLSFHDTKIFGETGSDNGPGILPALRKFMREHPEWSVVYHTDANYGFTVLGRLPEDKPKLPSLPKMAWNYTKALAKHAMTGSKLARQGTIDLRLNKCFLCSQRTENRCAVCGCYLDEGPDGAEGKTLWVDSWCPLGEWSQELLESAHPVVLYYSNNAGSPAVLQHCLRELAAHASSEGCSLVTVTQAPVDYGNRKIVVSGLPRSHESIYRQILLGLKNLSEETMVCFAEHDVLYPEGYFRFMQNAISAEPNRLCYNRNVWHLTKEGFLASDPSAHFMSNVAGTAKLLRSLIEVKLQETLASPTHAPVWAEPGIDVRGVEDSSVVRSVSYTVPTLDVRYGGNFTGMRSGEYVDHLKPWGAASQFTHLFVKSIWECYAELCSQGFCSDKGSTHSYFDAYDELLAPLHGRASRILEIGYQEGHSLRLWKTFLPLSDIVGLDLSPCGEIIGVETLVGDATSPDVRGQFTEQFDVIIDDASHDSEEQVQTFRLYRTLLNSGGIYVIEDVQSDDAIKKLCEVEQFREIDLRSRKGRYDDRLLIYQA
jgi:cephalosporin hydroxylase